MKLNTKVPSIRTHEGAVAKHINAEQQLRRSVMACMLWESEFYEGGKSIGDRIRALVPEVAPEKVQQIAVEARTDMKLRHVPLLLTYAMTEHASHRHLVAETLEAVIQRADELTEYCALYFALGGRTLSAQSKKGLGKAFAKFSEYELAKYNRDGRFKLRDVLFMSHSKPVGAGAAKYTRQHRKDGVAHPLTLREDLYKRLVDNELKTPDTWEVALSGGADKKDAFTRLMNEDKLGALAFLRNLRNMREAGIAKQAVKDYSERLRTDRVLPFRFVAAARAVPQWEDILEPLMLKCLEAQPKLRGKTALLVDVSGSMATPISSRSDLHRVDAAYGLAILLRELCEEVEIFSFSNKVLSIPLRRGFALSDAIASSQEHRNTFLGVAVGTVNDKKYDRIIVITDEQATDKVPDPVSTGYMINVASARNGVGYGAWHHIDGWSEAVIDYVRALEG